MPDPKNPRDVLAELAAALKPLAEAPGCAWCGSPAFVYVSRFDGQQTGECCPVCLSQFGEDAKVTGTVAWPDFETVRTAPLPSILATWDAMARVCEAAKKLTASCEWAKAGWSGNHEMVYDEEARAECASALAALTPDAGRK